MNAKRLRSKWRQNDKQWVKEFSMNWPESDYQPYGLSQLSLLFADPLPDNHKKKNTNQDEELKVGR